MVQPDYNGNFIQSDVSDLPESVDWRDVGAVTSVDDQGICPSCWGHSSVACVEGRLFIKTQKLIKLSVQELISCRPNDIGCKKGGSAEEAFEYMRKNGIGLAEDHPFMSEFGEPPSCPPCGYLKKFQRINVVKGYRKVPFVLGDESHLMREVAKGPVMATIVAGPNFQNYKGGLYTADETIYRILKPDLILHDVCIVGYDFYEGKKCWILKNSYSDEWGEKGYMYMARDGKKPWGISGILFSAYYPILEGDDDVSDYSPGQLTVFQNLLRIAIGSSRKAFPFSTIEAKSYHEGDDGVSDYSPGQLTVFQNLLRIAIGSSRQAFPFSAIEAKSYHEASRLQGIYVAKRPDTSMEPSPPKVEDSIHKYYSMCNHFGDYY